ncbi:interleukin-20 receptor subunit beta [Leuresthes tenuis]|uniref:interleukin-20 receptor subunit beta n=1 Tax=Leuresthes tenuis TaxID=355514 RepID=UPI003B50FC73
MAGTLRCILALLILLDFTNDIWTLPAPSSVSMDSVNMRHVLRWRPLQAACNTTVLYSVQYQGEFELLVRNGLWLDAAECQRIPLTHCDLTFDLGSDSSYSLRVRAQCSSQLSVWTRLSRPFNRRDTVLTAPEMKVVMLDNTLQVSFDNLPLTATASVTLWEKEHEQKAVVYQMPAEEELLHFAALQEGAVYCVQAQLVLHSGLRSSSTAPRCVSLTGPDAAAWKAPTTVTVTAVVMLGLLFALFWSIVHCRPDSCQSYFHKEPLPQSLKGNWDIQMLMVGQEEELIEAVPELLSTSTEQKAS